MILASDIRAAHKAVTKLNVYMDGVFAAGGRDATAKYLELNRKANEAINKLPEGIIRTRLGLALAHTISNR
jgi:hypothetical protein